MYTIVIIYLIIPSLIVNFYWLQLVSYLIQFTNASQSNILYVL